MNKIKEAICRSCLEPADKMYPLMGIVLNVDVNIATMLSYCTTNELELNDDLPDSVCIPCFKTIRIAYNFLLQFSESQKKLLHEKNKIRNKLRKVQVDNKIACHGPHSEHSNDGEEFNSNEHINYLLDESTNSNDSTVITTADTNYISYDLGAIHNYAGKNEHEQATDICFEEDKCTLNLYDTGDVIDSDAEDDKHSVIEHVEDLDVKDNLPNSSDTIEEYIILTADTAEETVTSNPVHVKKVIQKDDTSYASDYVCPMCNITIQRFPKFYDHILLHNSETIVCTKCSLQTEFSPLQYIQHYKENHRYQCNICDRSLKSSYGFRYHMKHHENIRQYECPAENCKKSYFLLHLLRKHMYTHSETIKHTCNLCGATFRTYDTYRYHQKTHDGTRNHLCTICGKAFFQAVHLRDHIFRHTGYKRFTCDMCGTSFTTNSQLKKHFRYCRRFRGKSIKEIG